MKTLPGVYCFALVSLALFCVGQGEEDAPMKAESIPDASDQMNDVPSENKVTNGSNPATPEDDDINDEATNSTTPRLACAPRAKLPEGTLPSVQLINASWVASTYRPWSNNTPPLEQDRSSSEGPCSLVLFYARWCPFSCQAAPHFNALARAFPTLPLLALDASFSWRQQTLNTQLGVVAVPTVLLFHNSKPAAKFNGSEYTLEAMAAFVSRHTDLVASTEYSPLNVTSADFDGPVPSSMDDGTDPWLWAAWLFLAGCAARVLLKSTLWTKVAQAVRTAWQEAQAQRDHEHAD